MAGHQLTAIENYFGNDENLLRLPSPASLLESSGYFLQGKYYWWLCKGKCGNVCKDIDGKRWCDNYCNHGSGALVKVLMGPVLPRKVPVTFSWEYELCQERKCVWGTKVGTFGASQPPPVISKEGYSSGRQMSLTC